MSNVTQPDIDSATPEELEEIAGNLRQLIEHTDNAEFACQLDITACVLERFVANIREELKPVEEALAALHAVWPSEEALQ